MPVPMREHPTETVNVTFTGPGANRDKAVMVMKDLGFMDASEYISWRDLFPDITDEELPGKCLSGARHREGLTQKRLSELTGILQHHISEMENGKRPIGKKNAKLFAKALNTNYRVLL